MRIDLHTHSNASDGTESPGDVIRAAAVAGLDVIGLADHDTTAGLGDAATAAREAGLEVVPGVEVSTRHRGMSVHVLALWPALDDPEFLGMLGRTRSSRVVRAREMVERLARDHPLDWDGVAARSLSADTVGRPHIADALIDAGVVTDRIAAFATLLANDSPYYVPHHAPESVEAIGLIRRVGGVPVLAHAGAESRGRTLTDDDIETLVEVGLVGLEVDHRDHSPAQVLRLGALARRLGLIRTGGSDYHGTGKPNTLGENLTSPEAYAALGLARG